MNDEVSMDKQRELARERAQHRAIVKAEKEKQQVLKKRLKKLRKSVEKQAKRDAADRAHRWTAFNPAMDGRVYEVCINRYVRKLEKIPLPKDQVRLLESGKAIPEGEDEPERPHFKLQLEDDKENEENSALKTASQPVVYGDLLKTVRRSSRALRQSDKQQRIDAIKFGWHTPTGNQKPMKFTILDDMYTAEEKELLQVLKNDKVRIVPSKAEHSLVPQEVTARDKLEWRWAQDPSWVVMWSVGSTSHHPPQHMFDGEMDTMWSPTVTRPNQEHWCVLDFRCTQVIDGFRLKSLPWPYKHTLRHFRVETSNSASGPWKVIDYYEYRNHEVREAGTEAWYDFVATTRYLRLYVESGTTDCQPRIHSMSLRLRGPTVHLARPSSFFKKRQEGGSNGRSNSSDGNNTTRGKAVAWQDKKDGRTEGDEGVKQKQKQKQEQQQSDDDDDDDDDKEGSPTKEKSKQASRKPHHLPKFAINPDVTAAAFCPDTLLHVRGAGFSLEPADNVVELICLDDDRPPPTGEMVHHHHTVGEYAHRRIVPGSHPPDKDYLPTLLGVCVASSQTHLQLQVRGLDRRYVGGALAAQVTVHGVKMRTHVPVARVVEQVVDPFLFVQEKTLDPDPEELLRAMRTQIRNADVIYWGLRALAMCCGSGRVLTNQELEEIDAAANARLQANKGTKSSGKKKSGGDQHDERAVAEKEQVETLGRTARSKFGAYTAITEDGVPCELVYTTIQLVLEVMKPHKDHISIQAWGCALLSAYADEHATRMALMSEDWIETVVEPMKALVEQRAIELRSQNKVTFETEYETVYFLPSACQQLALNGLSVLSGMAREDKHRDYVAAQGIPAVLHCMGECEGEEHCLVQAYGCLCLHNFVFRNKDAWEQATNCDALAYVETAKELDLLDETLQKNATNAWHALQKEGWKGRRLVEDLKLNEMHSLKQRKKKHDAKMEVKLAKMKETGEL